MLELFNSWQSFVNFDVLECLLCQAGGGRGFGGGGGFGGAAVSGAVVSGAVVSASEGLPAEAICPPQLFSF